MAVAAGVTYYALLAIFPAIAALVSIYGLFADPRRSRIISMPSQACCPGAALDIIREQVIRIASQGGGTLGFGFVFGLVLSLWSANAGMKAVIDALNIVYDEEEKRSFVALNSSRWPSPSVPSPSFSSPSPPSSCFRSSSTSSASAAGSSGCSRWRAGRSSSSASCWACRPLPLRPEPRQARMEVGHAGRHRGGRAVARRVDAVLVVCGELRQLQRDLRLARRRDRLHDLDLDLGIVVLLGAEINAEMEHQTAKDTTEGAPTADGEPRRAMADTIGAAKA